MVAALAVLLPVAARGGPQVDEKRVINLSAHRMEQLTR
jgi:hypothetical protein